MEMDTKINPVLRDYRFDYNDKNIEYYIWIEEDWCSFEKLVLDGDDIQLSFNDYICNRCHQMVDKLEFDLCSNCMEVDNDFQIRLKCIFNKKDSMLQEGCTKVKPACRSLDNVRFCFQKYILYIGRIGDHIKIGISRKNRRGGYLSRLIEQGLNEAIVIDSINSLPEVAKEEQWFRDIGMPDKITGKQKINCIENSKIVYTELVKKPVYGENDSIRVFDNSQLLRDYNLSSVWTFALMREKYNLEELHHFLLYPDNITSFPNLKERVDRLAGEVLYIQGSKVITRDQEKYYINEMNSLKHKQIEGMIW